VAGLYSTITLTIGNRFYPTMLILASQSPRRLQLLQQIGITCQVQIADIDETPQEKEIPCDYVARLAYEKAHAVWQGRKQSAPLPILGADTSVILDAEILGKPDNIAHAIDLLQRLSGRSHQVLTAIALLYPDASQATGYQYQAALSSSMVQFAVLSSRDIQDYLATGEAMDKAGAYGIQGYAARFITQLSGSYSGVMGLPLYEVGQLLKRITP
jgi:septum formation protein